MTRVATFTTQVESSMTMTPAEPSIEPAAASESKSMPMSRPNSGISGAETPPGITALILRPGGGPPACFSTNSRSGMPMGSS